MFDQIRFVFSPKQKSKKQKKNQKTLFPCFVLRSRASATHAFIYVYMDIVSARIVSHVMQRYKAVDGQTRLGSVAISPFLSLLLLLSFASKEEAIEKEKRAIECGRGIEGFGFWRYVIGCLCLQFFCSGNVGSDLAPMLWAFAAAVSVYVLA